MTLIRTAILLRDLMGSPTKKFHLFVWRTLLNRFASESPMSRSLRKRVLVRTDNAARTANDAGCTLDAGKFFKDRRRFSQLSIASKPKHLDSKNSASKSCPSGPKRRHRERIHTNASGGEMDCITPRTILSIRLSRNSNAGESVCHTRALHFPSLIMVLEGNQFSCKQVL